ncbi:protein STRUBBELIG-RECEPTOR FAMILY 3 [Cryptomeria japonica]|uniref:protein STRUBBELIG-RECEPTOR FAMILY 3 n=1 Tax=Cryptomeria japonica TaxID=3369 RepID=UPI0025AC9140|nr:protein STRUBBELIG-RECEPTOR FAMILY 3 [Cryptomeria japonica]
MSSIRLDSSESWKHKSGQATRGGGRDGRSGEKILVAVNGGAKEMNKCALEWALTNVVQPGDCLTILALVSADKSGRRSPGFPIFARDCAGGYKRSHNGYFSQERRDAIRDSCSQMVLQLNNVCDTDKVNVNAKVVSAESPGAVVSEAKNLRATWVILDKQLKKEEKYCMEELHCNLVVMKRSSPKILRLNLLGSQTVDAFECSSPCLDLIKVEGKATQNNTDKVLDSVRGGPATPSSSPDLGTPFTATEVATSSTSSSDQGTSPFMAFNMIIKPLETIDRDKNCQEAETTDFEDEITISDSDSEETSSPSANFDIYYQNRLHVKPYPVYRDSFPGEIKKSAFSVSSVAGTVPGALSYLSTSAKFSNAFQLPSKWTAENMSQNTTSKLDIEKLNSKSETTRILHDRFSQLDKEARIGKKNCVGDLDRTSTVRKAMALQRNAPLGPPPLCSICQHKAPAFGKPPRWFSYAELQHATDGFSQANFLAEGGFGSVHRGILPDGQTVAVKQHKPASSQGDLEFCSEVEVLSCAQHRNVVTLIGYCIENKRRLLVYEYICNGSLDTHLYGQNRETLEWSARQKIAIGAARGLRYLHEECRVGCIVHRDLRPNNILLTHDFEPMVGDFGLARWQPDGDLAVETRVIGTFGYLAPEYAQSGQITEKADVYSFGVVLVELVTGRKAVDINRPKGQQCLTEWARPLLEEHAIYALVDPRLGNNYSQNEVYCMLHAASLCIRKDSHLRPRMSQVLRILEGNSMIDASCAATPAYGSLTFVSRTSTSSEYCINQIGAFNQPVLDLNSSLDPDSIVDTRGKMSLFGEPHVNNTGKLSYEALKAAYRKKGSCARSLLKTRK